MSERKVHPLVWGFILFCIVSLALGLGWLEIMLPGGFPLGTVATWLMLIVFAWALLRLAPRMTRRRQLAALGQILAVCWYPISWFQAGNPMLTFSGDSFPWLVWTGVVSGWLLSLAMWTLSVALRRAMRIRRDGSAA